MSGYATVLGFAYESPTTEFPARTGPGTTFALAPFKAQKGWRDLTILDVQPDAQNTPNDSDPSQVYQWFHLLFPNGQSAWLRGHVVGLYGDCRAWGYGVLNTATHAYTLRRAPVDTSTPTPETTVTTVTTPAEEPPAPETALTAVTTPAEEPPAPAINPMAAAAAQVKMEPAAAPAPDTKMTGQPVAIIKAQLSAPTRRGPSTTFERAVTIDRHTRVPLLEVARENMGQRYRWFKLLHQNQQVWIREDLVTYQGDTTALGLPVDLYPAPMKTNYWWVRGFNMPPNRDNNIAQHDGWDLGAQTGEPIYCGPNGGLVVKSFTCTKCTPERPSAVPPGGRAGDPSVMNDPGWGYGYGHYLIVRYLNEQLPQSTRSELTQRGFPGGHLFVMYAHLDQRLVGEGQRLEGEVQLATCGNTGNSEGPHVHLEVRASRVPDLAHWANIRDGLMDPVVLFMR